MNNELADIYTQLERSYFRGVGLRLTKEQVREIFGTESEGVGLIAGERRRQIREEGYTPEHDDAHAKGELASAAVTYAIPHRKASEAIYWWPWDNNAPITNWNDSNLSGRRERIKELAKAGALIAAEIERLQRKGKL